MSDKANTNAPKDWLLLKNGRGVRTGEVKLNFPNLFELNPEAEINKDQYTTNIIISEEEKDFLLKVVAANAYKDAISTFNKWNGKKPSNFQSPNFKELEEETVTAFGLDSSKKWFSIMLKTRNKPTVIDLQTNKITDPSEIYSGTVARVSLSAFPWAFSGKQGISFALGIVQKVADGTRVGGSPTEDMSLFADTISEEVSMFGGDPFASTDTQQPKDSVASGSDDSDLTLPEQEPKAKANGKDKAKQDNPFLDDDLPF